MVTVRPHSLINPARRKLATKNPKLPENDLHVDKLSLKKPASKSSNMTIGQHQLSDNLSGIVFDEESCHGSNMEEVDCTYGDHMLPQIIGEPSSTRQRLSAQRIEYMDRVLSSLAPLSSDKIPRTWDRKDVPRLYELVISEWSPILKNPKTFYKKRKQCPLCGHPNVSMLFLIENKFTKNKHLAASVCVTHFQIKNCSKEESRQRIKDFVDQCRQKRRSFNPARFIY